MKTDYPVYRIGEQQRATLLKLQQDLEQHEDDCLVPLIDAALGADLPAQAIAEAVGLSYSGLAAWAKDGQLSAARKAAWPRVQLVAKAIGLGVATGLLPAAGDKAAPALAILIRLMEMRDERDEARFEIARLRGQLSTPKKSAASNETVESYALAE